MPHQQSVSTDSTLDGILLRPTLQPQRYQPCQPLLPYVEHDIAIHRQRNLDRNARRWYQHRGGLHWLRLGRLTVQWSWRRS